MRAARPPLPVPPARAALSALVALLVCAAPARADWGAPVELSAVSGSARLPHVAIAPSGVAIVVSLRLRTKVVWIPTTGGTR